jgi:DNA-binding MarR family transcriptional regulator
MDAMDLDVLPGPQIRRLHQISVAVFLQETAAHGVTPVQYAALHAVQLQPGMDQRTLAGTVGLDTSTVGGVINRLESRGLLARNASPTDRRVRLLSLTPEGKALLAAIQPAIAMTQERILAPLSPEERDHFMRLLNVLVSANNEISRAPVP